jgi:hypothetical protein
MGDCPLSPTVMGICEGIILIFFLIFMKRISGKNKILDNTSHITQAS